MILEARNFSKRIELEIMVRNELGLTPDLKQGSEIRGTREELNRLQLSDKTLFHGIKCIITDFPTQVRTQRDVPKPQRGEIKEFGLNNQLKKPNNV